MGRPSPFSCCSCFLLVRGGAVGLALCWVHLAAWRVLFFMTFASMSELEGTVSHLPRRAFMSSILVSQNGDCFFILLRPLRGDKPSCGLRGTEGSHSEGSASRCLWHIKVGFRGGVQDVLYLFIFMQVADLSLMDKVGPQKPQHSTLHLGTLGWRIQYRDFKLTGCCWVWMLGLGLRSCFN